MGPNKLVFAHYMIGTIDDRHCQIDIWDAKNLGVDAFALNIDNPGASWAQNTVASLFNHANDNSPVKLFFSFDMNSITDPSEFIGILNKYAQNDAYLQIDGRPFVSTFRGGGSQFIFGQGSASNGWHMKLQQPMANIGRPIYFVPAFEDDPSDGTNFFQDRPTLDGAMNWNSWPNASLGRVPVSSFVDQNYRDSARLTGKSFMMGISTQQFKHIDGGQNWYLRGAQNLELRLGQVLELQPDFIEFQTWNDSGESHYIGNIWPEPIGGINSVIGSYTLAPGLNHTGFWEILKSFFTTYKSGGNLSTMVPTNGQSCQGVFWHHTLLAGADCSGDPLGPPRNRELIEDRVSAVVLVQAGVTNLVVDVYSGDNHLGSRALVPGFNDCSAGGLTTGFVKLVIHEGSTEGPVVKQARGPIPVSASSNMYNYNFQVVAVP